MTTFNLAAQNLIANQWFFSAPVTVPDITHDVQIRATDPNGQWFTRPGNVKAWGIQMQGYVGGPWDNQDPWLGWGWFAYAAPTNTPPDVLAGLVLPQAWVPFGSSFKGDRVTVALGVFVASSNVVAASGAVIRLAVQTDADIRLGTQVILL